MCCNQLLLLWNVSFLHSTVTNGRIFYTLSAKISVYSIEISNILEPGPHPLKQCFLTAGPRLGTGPSSYKKKSIYRAAVSQWLRTAALKHRAFSLQVMHERTMRLPAPEHMRSIKTGKYLHCTNLRQNTRMRHHSCCGILRLV